MVDSLPSCGARLRALRLALPASLPVSMSALADAAGCSYAHLRMIEEGYRDPGYQLAVRLAHALTAHAGRTIDVTEFYDAATRRRAA